MGPMTDFFVYPLVVVVVQISRHISIYQDIARLLICLQILYLEHLDWNACELYQMVMWGLV